MLVDRVLQNRRARLTNAEQNILNTAVVETRTYPAGHVFGYPGEDKETCSLLLEGVMSRYVDDVRGRRRLVALHLPSDFVDLHGYVLKSLDHEVGALTDVRIGLVPHAAIERIQDEHPQLARKLWFMTMLDAAQHRWWAYRLSSLTGISRVAHFLCEINARLIAIGESDGRFFKFPMTQTELGEVCGLTNVHVNRVLRTLREEGLCTVKSSTVQIHDLPGLVRVGEFLPAYLYLDAATEALAVGRA